MKVPMNLKNIFTVVNKNSHYYWIFEDVLEKAFGPLSSVGSFEILFIIYIFYILLFTFLVSLVIGFIWKNRFAPLTPTMKLKIFSLWTLLKLFLLPAFGVDSKFHHMWKVLAIGEPIEKAYQVTPCFHYDYPPGFIWFEYAWGRILQFFFPEIMTY